MEMSSVPIRSNGSFLGWTSITEAHDGEGHTLRVLQIVNHSIKHQNSSALAREVSKKSSNAVKHPSV